MLEKQGGMGVGGSGVWGGGDVTQKTGYFEVNLSTECKKVSFLETRLGTV